LFPVASRANSRQNISIPHWGHLDYFKPIGHDSCIHGDFFGLFADAAGASTVDFLLCLISLKFLEMLEGIITMLVDTHICK